MEFEVKLTKEELSIVKNALEALNRVQGTSLNDSALIIQLFNKLQSLIPLEGFKEDEGKN